MLEKRLPGFAPGVAVLTAPESRSSSLVRLLRDETRQSAPRPVPGGRGEPGTQAASCPQPWRALQRRGPAGKSRKIPPVFSERAENLPQEEIPDQQADL